ncbi:unnamed protein product [Blepharisma stoltei]|uniref:GIY-YIG homing endonuclease n=1 Tax=Blepharisma stoltei TaxID=1481888 RepID=A0AAU9JY40_9CILI|nr:unnamed protein product [Blepharisma stoltei]
MKTKLASNDFFYLLYIAAKENYVHLPVPKSLIRDSRLKTPILVEKTVKTYIFKNIQSEEIETIIVNNFKEKHNFPCAIIKTLKNRILCFSVQEIIKIWNSSSENLIIQEYLECKGGKPHIVRIKWKTPGHIRATYISYDDEEDTDKFILSEAACESEVLITASTIELNKYAETLKNILEYSLSHIDLILEFSADFLQDISGRWYFISIDNYSLCKNRQLLSFRSEKTLRTESSTATNRSHKHLDMLSFNGKSTPVVNKCNTPLPFKNIMTPRNNAKEDSKVPAIPHIKSKRIQKEKELNFNIKELMGFPRSRGIAYITYDQWNKRVWNGNRMSPNDWLYANKIAKQKNFMKHKVDKAKHKMRKLIETMTTLTNGVPPESDEDKNLTVKLPVELLNLSSVPKEDLFEIKAKRQSFIEAHEKFEFGVKRIDEMLKRIAKTHEN